MALFHRATLNPTKAELIARWAPTQPWGPPADAPIQVIGSYRFDDPEGRVGMETHLVTAGGSPPGITPTYPGERTGAAAPGLIRGMGPPAVCTPWGSAGVRG